MDVIEEGGVEEDDDDDNENVRPAKHREKWRHHDEIKRPAAAPTLPSASTPAMTRTQKMMKTHRQQRDGSRIQYLPRIHRLPLVMV